MRVSDFRSDTVTKPVAAMLDAMMRAEVGDDVYGEDPSVNALEDRVAKLLGKDSGMFVPSGTMANQIAIHLLAPAGTSVIAEEDSHVYLYEAGAAAVHSGVQFDLIPFAERFSAEAIAKRFKPEGIHFASTSLVVVENTHNRGAGRVFDATQVGSIVDSARRHGLKVHCDGARLWNAAAALNVAESSLVNGIDTVSVCFSKGLGAPVGSVLTGPKDVIGRGRKIRKRWGGGMRQIGFLASAANWALDHHRERLVEDHRRVKAFHDGIAGFAKTGLPVACSLPDRWTNILYFNLTRHDSARFIDALRQRGVLMSDVGQGRIRIVTHLHITDDCIGRALEAVKDALSQS